MISLFFVIFFFTAEQFRKRKKRQKKKPFKTGKNFLILIKAFRCKVYFFRLIPLTRPFDIVQFLVLRHWCWCWCWWCIIHNVPPVINFKKTVITFHSFPVKLLTISNVSTAAMRTNTNVNKKKKRFSVFKSSLDFVIYSSLLSHLHLGKMNNLPQI